MFASMSRLPLQQRGMALVIVIWILTLLSLMAGSFAMTMRRESSISYAITSSASAVALAESGVTLAEFNLANTDPEQRWLADGTIYEIIRPESRTRIRIFAESGKVDLNTASQEQLAAILNAVVKDEWQQQQLLNAILDWRDADDDTREQGAERRQYRLAGFSYGPTNAAFQSIEELQLVLGMNTEIFQIMQPFITVYSGESTVNQRYASPELLNILAADLKQRNVHDVALENRLQNNPMDNTESGESEQTSVSEGQTYTIIVESLIRQEASAGVEAVVRYQSNAFGMPFETLDWKQNLQPASLFSTTIESPLITIQDEFRYDDRY